MTLLDLPLELLDAIISLTIPSGIESLSISCKAVYARAASQLLRHNELKKRWRCTATYDNRRDTLRILHSISRDPLVAHYIESLSLWSGDQYEEKFLPDEEDMELIKALVLRSELFDNAGVDPQDWWSAMVKENDDNDEHDWRDDNSCHTTISLLALLPNLRALQLPSGWYDRDRRRWYDGWQEDKARLTAMTDALVADSNSSGKALSKLQYIIPSTEDGYESRPDLQCLESFMRLRSLEELYTVSCIAVHDGSGFPFTWSFPSHSSSLRRIELAYCCIDADGLSNLIAHTPLLEVFRYGHETKWHGCQHDWNAGAFIETLGKHCGKTITILAITLDGHFGEIEKGVTCFTPFSFLKELEFDLRILCGPPYNSELEQDGVENISEMRASWTVAEIPKLGDMLPGSITNVEINTQSKEQDEEALKVLLRDFRSDREKFGHLNQVIVRQYSNVWAKSLVKEAGAKLAIFNQQGLQGWRVANMPMWKRAFEWRVEGIRGMYPSYRSGKDVGV